jgi:Flp pilus assembly protein TadB
MKKFLSLFKKENLLKIKDWVNVAKIGAAVLAVLAIIAGVLGRSHSEDKKAYEARRKRIKKDAEEVSEDLTEAKEELEEIKEEAEEDISTIQEEQDKRIDEIAPTTVSPEEVEDWEDIK